MKIEIKYKEVDTPRYKQIPDSILRHITVKRFMEYLDIVTHETQHIESIRLVNKLVFFNVYNQWLQTK